MGFAFSASGFCSRFALGETVRCIAGLDDAAVVGNPIQQCGCHLCIAEHRHPFAELEVCGDDDAGCLIQLADQMKQQRPARFREWDIAEFVDDDAIQSGQLLDDFPWVSLGLLCDEGVDQIDGIVEAYPLSSIDQVGPERDGNVRLSSASSPDEDDVMRVISELT